ncbi:MAG: metallophosphoesterase [Oscillospiraceae bacterium]|jgi:predicted phosphodiesterase|nr:metallophosphoesterase [Oscillospiraceae bacterium]
MTKYVKRWMSPLLCALLLAQAVSATTVFAADRAQAKLTFGEDGKFTILQLADTQEDLFPHSAMLEYIARAVAEVQPDLVVFTGDNTADISFLTGAFWFTIPWIVEPVARAGVPFTLTFGNHDALLPKGKDWLLRVYQQYDNCLAADMGGNITGSANHYLPIYDAAGRTMLYNLWFIDSNAYDIEHINISQLDQIPYDHVRADQLNWLRTANAQLKAANGGKTLPSMTFQHIIPYEISQLLREAPGGESATAKYGDRYYYREFAQDAKVEPGWRLGEFPCAPAVNGGEVEVLREIGCEAVVVGHDHVNQFIATLENGVQLINTGSLGFDAYGADETRGARVIELTNGEGGVSYDASRIVTYEELFDASEEDRAFLAVGKGVLGKCAAMLGLLGAVFGFDRHDAVRQITAWFAAVSSR